MNYHFYLKLSLTWCIFNDMQGKRIVLASVQNNISAGTKLVFHLPVDAQQEQ
jgi:hypothetical protein